MYLLLVFLNIFRYEINYNYNVINDFNFIIMINYCIIIGHLSIRIIIKYTYVNVQSTKVNKIILYNIS